MLILPSNDRFFSNVTTPILSPQHPLLVLKTNLEYPVCPIISERTNINGFMILNFKVVINSFRFVDSLYGGSFCDHKSLINGDVMSNRCPCIQIMNWVGITAIHWDSKVNLEYENNYNTHISSKWFMQKYMLTG